MAAKFFTGLPLAGPDPECVKGHGEAALAAAGTAAPPRPAGDHSHRAVPVSIGRRPPDGAGRPGPGITTRQPPAHACDEHPLAGTSLAEFGLAGRAG
jgi:hypothetical protein